MPPLVKVGEKRAQLAVVRVQQSQILGAHLVVRCNGRRQHCRRLVAKKAINELDKLGLCVCIDLVDLADTVGRRLANKRRSVGGTLFNAHDLDLHNFSHANAAQHAQRQTADKLVCIRQVALKAIYGEERELAACGVRVGMVHEVRIHELFHFDGLDNYVSNNIRVVLGDIPSLCHHRKQVLHAFSLFADARLASR